MKINKESLRGITLIALVVTIVCLIIMAGVTINFAIGNQGLFKKTKNATDSYTTASEEEQKGLDNLVDFLKEQDLANAKKDSEQSNTNNDIGVAQDGKSVNLDLWNYQLSEDRTYYELCGSYIGSGTYECGYKGQIIDGTIEGEMPSYINSIKVTLLTNGLFYNLTNLNSITIPDSVTNIESEAFLGCTSLSSITIPDSVTSIGSGAFEECTSLSSITIPNSVTSIGENAFYFCTNLSNITIPNSVTSIGWEVFGYWTSSQTINVPFKSGAKPSGWDSSWDDNCDATIVYAK